MCRNGMHFYFTPTVNKKREGRKNKPLRHFHEPKGAAKRTVNL